MNSAPSTSQRLGRPADRQELIVDELRRWIVNGHLEPGSRLPTRPEIEERFGAGTSTVQRALDQLKRDGFITSHGRNGTTVVNNPPHLARYALIFSDQPTHRVRVNFWPALANEAMRLEQHNDFDVPLYYGVDGHTDAPDYQRLVNEVKQHRLAGLIFPAWPYPMEKDPLLLQKEVPIAVVGSVNGNIRLDAASFWRRACEHLAQQGRKRIACLTASDSEEIHADIVEHTSAFGLETRPYWWQIHNNRTPRGSVNAMHLMFLQGQPERPDGLIIFDDNLVEPATRGLLAAGMRPQDLDIVAHSNFPWSTPSELPVRRLGFHAREILLRSIEYIDAARRHEPLTEPLHIPARFEGEFEVLEQNRK